MQVVGVSPIEPDSATTRPPKTVQKGAKEDAIDSVLPEPEAPRLGSSGSPPPVGATSSRPSSELRASGDIGRGELKGGQVDDGDVTIELVKGKDAETPPMALHSHPEVPEDVRRKLSVDGSEDSSTAVEKSGQRSSESLGQQHVTVATSPAADDSSQDVQSALTRVTPSSEGQGGRQGVEDQGEMAVGNGSFPASSGSLLRPSSGESNDLGDKEGVVSVSGEPASREGSAGLARKETASEGSMSSSRKSRPPPLEQVQAISGAVEVAGVKAASQAKSPVRHKDFPSERCAPLKCTQHPVFVAAANGDMAALRQLEQLDRSSLALKLDWGWTAAHLAAACGQDDVLLYMYARDPRNLMVKNDAGQNPLHYAAANGQLYATRVLVKRAPDLMLWKCNDGRRPADMAKAGKCRRLLKYMYKVHVRKQAEIEKKNQSCLPPAVLRCFGVKKKTLLARTDSLADISLSGKQIAATDSSLHESQVGTMLQYMEASKVDHSGHHTHTAHHVSPVVARGRLPTDII